MKLNIIFHFSFYLHSFLFHLSFIHFWSLVKTCGYFVTEFSKDTFLLCSTHIFFLFLYLCFLDHSIHLSKIIVKVFVCIYLFFIIQVGSHISIPCLWIGLSTSHVTHFSHLWTLLYCICSNDVVVSLLFHLFSVIT